jgi:hypothetical protein
MVRVARAKTVISCSVKGCLRAHYGKEREIGKATKLTGVVVIFVDGGDTCEQVLGETVALGWCDD